MINKNQLQEVRCRVPVDDEVGGTQHVETPLIPLAGETESGNLVCQPPQTSSWNQNPYAGRSAAKRNITPS